MGARCARNGTHTAAEGGEQPGAATVGNSIQGDPATHFTVEGDDAVSGIRAARTYMLSSLTNAVIPSRPTQKLTARTTKMRPTSAGCCETAVSAMMKSALHLPLTTKMANCSSRVFHSVQACACSLPVVAVRRARVVQEACRRRS